jgi:quinohemoprotein ethanol dehydrogenase
MRFAIAKAIAISLGAWMSSAAIAASPSVVLRGDSARIADETDGKNWISYGRTYAETHASPLKQINTSNVARLGLVWSVELPDVTNGATQPLAVDGIVYFTAGPSLVHAIDARTGKLLWRFDPKVNHISTKKMRYAWGPRGIAYWNKKVYVGTNDGRLIAIDATTGKEVWSQMTVDINDQRTITGAPRVFNGKVIIGHGGAEFGPVRGYVTTYDAETGKQLWRFYAVPGNPADGFEDKAMEMAAKTWTGEWWKYGGGGTIWNAITYDPEFNYVYLGTGNGAPWNQKIRSPGGGDNLFLASIVAVNADTGEYVWHYQANPANTWDYTNTMDMTLATLRIDGRERKVLMQAPKNGFMYVLDRTNGKLISAEKFDFVNWASHIDLATGRPVENPGMRYTGAVMYPGSGGAHSFMPQAYSERLKTLFIPTMRMGGAAMVGPARPQEWQYRDGYMNIGYEGPSGPPEAPAPPPPEVPDDNTTSVLAWDPIAAKEKWRVKTPGVWNGGLMVTDGDLLFQGLGTGEFVAYDARDGRKLWSFDAKMGISGSPITYEVDGKQYVSVVAGWGGTGAAFLGMATAYLGWQARVHSHRIVTFALDGKARLPASLPGPMPVQPIDDSNLNIDAAAAQRGGAIYGSGCAGCHGGNVTAGGFAPDLRASPITLSAEAFRQVVQQGTLETRGMPKYSELTDEEVEQVRMYVRQVARDALSARRDVPFR